MQLQKAITRAEQKRGMRKEAKEAEPEREKSKLAGILSRNGNAERPEVTHEQ